MRKFRNIVSLTATILLFASCDPLYTFVVQNDSNYPVVVPQKFDGLEAGYNPQYGLHPGSSLQIAFPREEINIYPAN